MPRMLTTRVIASSTRAAYIRAPTSTLSGLGEMVGQQRRQRVGRRKQRPTNHVGVAHQHRQRHGLAQRPAEARMIEPKMPVAAVGTMIARIASQRVAPSPKAASRIFGGTATSASREMAEIVGSTMIASTSDAGSIPGPLSAVPKNRNPAQMVVQPVRRRAHHRDDDKDAPQAVDHAGDGRQQFDDLLQNVLNAKRHRSPERTCPTIPGR